MSIVMPVSKNRRIVSSSEFNPPVSVLSRALVHTLFIARSAELVFMVSVSNNTH